MKIEIKFYLNKLCFKIIVLKLFYFFFRIYFDSNQLLRVTNKNIKYESKLEHNTVDIKSYSPSFAPLQIFALQLTKIAS